VRVDKSRKNRGVREINELNSRWRYTIRRNTRDLAIFNEDEHVRDGSVSLPVDQMPGANGDRLRRSSRRPLRMKKRVRGRGEQSKKRYQQTTWAGHGRLL
jgi:hypothetical protein